MKNRIAVLLAVLVLVLSACAQGERTFAPISVSRPDRPTFVETEPPQVAATQPLVTEPEHSALYLPGVPVEDVISYFNEVCLAAEFSDGGDPSLIQKWCEPIAYSVEGDCTESDLAVLTGFMDWLNTVNGFPGIRPAQDGEWACLRIFFCPEQEMVERLGDDFYGCDGGVTFWYMDNEIYNAVICYNTAADQLTRNSVILEEVYNGLGPLQDTVLRPDSIIYQAFSQPQCLSPIDELILYLLYHPDIQPGMNALECEQVIRSLYY